MKNTIKQQEGFTLVEVIISIAILGLICAVVLRLFVLSNEVSEQSRIEDVASIHATNAIEVCKQAKNLDEIKKHPFFANAKLSKDESLKLEGVIEYDNYWQALPVDTAGVATDTVFQLHFSLVNSENFKSAEAKETDVALMDISISINQLEKETMSKKLVLEYTTRKYFVFEEYAHE